MSNSLVWFRNDLRLADNPALAMAVAEGAVTLVFVLDPAANWGGASLWWLHHSLASLQADCRARGGELVLRRGDSVEIIPALAVAVGAEIVHAGRAHEPWLRAVDARVDAALKAKGIGFHRLRSAAMMAPEAVMNKTGGVYGVYTPFSKAVFAAFTPREAIAAPERIVAGPAVAGEDLDAWGLLPTRPDWAGGMRAAWMPGEAGAWRLLDRFLEHGIEDYDQNRNVPGVGGTSMLSPYVHWGEISIDAVWRAAAAAETKRKDGKQTFLKELIWREFSIYLLWHHPDLATVPMNKRFEAMPWRDEPGELAAWQRGQTGIPIVDAGMRQLWQTGWMHNRVRMITASFLIKHLLIRWQDGEAWFWDCLCEADHAANAASWQWVAGCGADAAPYFRVFNPVLQGWKFDAAGDYVRQYVPELAGLPDDKIHTPWEASDEMLAASGVVLGESYPRPIVDLMAGRDRALAAYDAVKASA